MSVPTLYATTLGQQLKPTDAQLAFIKANIAPTTDIPDDAINGPNTTLAEYPGVPAATYPLAWLDLSLLTQGDTIQLDGINGTLLKYGVDFFNIDRITGTAYNDAFEISGVDDVIIYGSAGADDYTVSNGFATLSYAGLSAGITLSLEYVGPLLSGEVTKADGKVDTIGNDVGTNQAFGTYVGTAHDDVFLAVQEVGKGTTTNYDGGGADDVDTLSFVNWDRAVTVDLSLGKINTTGGDITRFGKVVGSDFNDNLTAGDFGSTLEGGLGTNVLNGGDGDDLFIGGAGQDNIDGGAGDDTVSYAGLTAGVTVTLDVGVFGGADGDADSTAKSGKDDLSSVEAVIGTAFDDTFSVAANAVVALFGGAGSNTVSYADSSVRVVADLDLGKNLTTGEALEGFTTIVGSDFNDDITTSNSASLIDGGIGNNVLTGGSGDDTFRGGLGKDIIDGGAGYNYLTYFPANIAVAVEINDVRGGSVTGVGKSGVDQFSNIDVVIGSTGDDTYHIITPSDANGMYFYAGAGTDSLTIDDSAAGWTTSTTVGFLGGSPVYVTTHTKGGVSFQSVGIDSITFNDFAYESNYKLKFDLNGDDKTDLAFAKNFGDPADVWWTHLRDGVTSTSNGFLDYIDATQREYLGWGTFGAHTKSALLFRDATSGDVVAYTMDGITKTDEAVTGLVIGSNFKSFGSADANGDYKSDLFLQDTITGDVYVSMGGGSASAPTFSTLASISGLTEVTGSGWTLLDVSTNARLGGGAELAFYNASTEEFRTYNVVGTTATLDWQNDLTSSVGGVSLNWQFATFADLDGNGTEDLVFRVGDGVVIDNGGTPQDISGLVYVWTMAADGSTILSQGTVGNPDYSWDIAQVADYTGDGKDDLLFTRGSDGATWYWSVDSATSSISSQGLAGYFEDWAIARADDYSPLR